jgi:hypothetical protein
VVRTRGRREGEDENLLRENYLCWCVCLSVKERTVGSRVGEGGCPNEFGENGLPN